MHEYAFRWTVAEYVRASHAVTRHARGVMSFIPIFACVAGVLFLAGVASSAISEARWPLYVAGALLVLWAAYVYSGVPWLRARRILREDPCAKDEVRHIVTREGFASRTGAVSVEIKWPHILQVVETQEFLLYYYNKRVAYFTPKRVIPQADLPALRVSLRELVGDRARLTQPPVATG